MTIWNGLTSDGAVVPIQVDEEGRVVAVGSGPDSPLVVDGDYLRPRNPDLGLGTANINLDADGGATFASFAYSTRFIDSSNTGSAALNGASQDGKLASLLVINRADGGAVESAIIRPDGGATFKGDVLIGDSGSSTTESGCYLGNYGGLVVNAVTDTTSDRLFLGKNKNNVVAEINVDGSASFGPNATASDDPMVSVGSTARRGTFFAYCPSGEAGSASLLENSVDGNSKVVLRHDGKLYLPGSLASSGTQNVSADAGGRLVLGTSDRRLKEDITPLSGMLDKVKGLNPVSYKWKDKENSGAGTNLGFIAQEMEEVFPEVTYETTEGMKGLNYPGLIAPLTKALQEALTRIEALEAKLAQLTGGNQ